MSAAKGGMGLAILALASFALVSSTCAAEGPLQDIVVKDLNAAAALAKANGDLAGEACWTALAGERINRVVLPSGAGIFQLTEAARLTRVNLAKPIVSDLTASACGPLARDAGMTIGQLAARVGLSVLPIPWPKF